MTPISRTRAVAGTAQVVPVVAALHAPRSAHPVTGEGPLATTSISSITMRDLPPGRTAGLFVFKVVNIGTRPLGAGAEFTVHFSVLEASACRWRDVEVVLGPESGLTPVDGAPDTILVSEGGDRTPSETTVRLALTVPLVPGAAAVQTWTVETVHDDLPVALPAADHEPVSA